MPIVAHGYGLVELGATTNFLVDDVVVALEAEPVIVVDDDVNVTVDEDGVVVTLDDPIEIEVE